MSTSLPAAKGLRAAIYTRVSTSSQQDNYSPESQLEGCLALAQSRGYSVADEHIYRDVASGFGLDRPRLTDLRAALRRGEFEVIIVNSFDRWASEQPGLYRLYAELSDAEALLTS